jgi:hypothetical protein
MNHSKTRLSLLGLALVALPLTTFDGSAQEVVVAASVEEIVEYLDSLDWWQVEGVTPLRVPHIILTGIHPAWRDDAQEMPVQWKKELFYRLMLPLVVHANDMIMTRRAQWMDIQESLELGAPIPPNTLDRLRTDLVRLLVVDQDEADALGSDAAALVQ